MLCAIKISGITHTSVELVFCTLFKNQRSRYTIKKKQKIQTHLDKLITLLLIQLKYFILDRCGNSKKFKYSSPDSISNFFNLDFNSLGNIRQIRVTSHRFNQLLNLTCYGKQKKNGSLSTSQRTSQPHSQLA